MNNGKKAEQQQTAVASEHDTELRRRVEEHLTRHPPKTGGVDADGLRLLHELQVHQVELQMQNVELQTARVEMESLLEKYSDLYDFAPVGYLTLSRAGFIVEINLAAAGLLGTHRTALLERRFRPFLAPADGSAFDSLLERAFASGSRETCEVALCRDAGHPPVEARMEALAGADTRECRVAMIDITGQKQAERDRLVLGKLESTGVLAAGLAHDFNNLLTVVLLNLELCESPASDSPNMARRLAAAKEAAFTAAGLTQQLITFARGGASIRRVTDMSRLLEEATGLALSGSSVRGEFRLADDLWPVEVDAGQIGQVIGNVVQNAREAMPVGGVVVIRAENETLPSPPTTGLPPGPYVSVRITDQGCGIAPEVLPSIYDPYFSTKQRGEQRGMGLGLTICHSIIQKHGGTIVIDSEPGAGTTVHVHLPAIRKPVPAGRAPERAKPLAKPRRGKLLVMDDEAQVCIVLGALLRRLGHEVELVPDGATAVESYQRALDEGRPFDAVLLDLTVKDGMGGREAMAALREIDSGVTAVVMSGYADNPVLREHALHGFKGALAKPFELDKLREMLARLMDDEEPCGTNS